MAKITKTKMFTISEDQLSILTSSIWEAARCKDKDPWKQVHIRDYLQIESDIGYISDNDKDLLARLNSEQLVDQTCGVPDSVVDQLMEQL